ncbi:L-seryl-tRNA(Sec) selenium transferase [Caminibacter sp.]
MNLFRKIPKVDKVVSHFKDYQKELITKITKDVIDNLREKIKNSEIDDIDEKRIFDEIKAKYEDITTPSIKNVINATGVIIHTNLGRSLIDERVFDKAKAISTHYCNLEYDLEKGKRGDRYWHTSKHLSFLFGCEDALIVNNNAAAVFLILNTFAKDKEVIVSRGELVEIGGSFRVPEVMKASGAILKEVGTTNKTHRRDYLENINENTAMIMKVHKSNYTIEGFSEEVPFNEIIQMAKENNLLDYYDLGSAYLPELPYGLSNFEPSIFEIMKHSPSLVSFSGDKLFGGVQAGIILGKKELIAKLKKNQILRMFRVDKITISLIEETAIAYIKKEYEKIPSLRMLFESVENLRKRAERFLSLTPALKAEIVQTHSFVGGGTMPNRKIPSIAVAIKGSAKKWEKSFREKLVIGRIENEKFLLDFRTIQDDEIEKLAHITNELLACKG